MPDLTMLSRTELQRRVEDALEVLVCTGGYDGAHHKAWSIDQAIRVLCGVPPGDWNKTPGEATNDEYDELVRESCAGEDGPDTYGWEIGVPP